MIVLHEDFNKYAIWENGTVIGLKEGATKDAQEAFEFFKKMEKKQANEDEKALKEGRCSVRYI
ncbi:MAG: hypothetical protein Q4B64_08980 [Spirochaetales bacterium]|nr:hypothetical protein [Spirochaetales bacterium]